MAVSEVQQSAAEGAPSVAAALPLLWGESPPVHFDTHIPFWTKCLVIVACAGISLLVLDAPIAAWAIHAHPMPDLTDLAAHQGDIARELMALEQWGQWTVTLLVVAAVYILDAAGKRRALAIAIGCAATVAVTYLLKELAGRSRPMMAVQQGWEPGQWVWGGPQMTLHGGSLWSSFPSAHATGAFALSTGLAWFYPRGRFFFMMLACITAAERIFHRAHFLSDVIAGMGIAVFVTRWTLHEKLAGRMIASFNPKIRKWWLG